MAMCICPCRQEFEPRRKNQIYLSAAHRQRDKDRRWPRKRQSAFPAASRNGPTERQEASASGGLPLPGTEGDPIGRTEAMRKGIELRLAQLGLLAKIHFGDIELPEADLLTTFEVSRYLRISRWTLGVWRTIHQGPPFVRLSRNEIRYLRRGLGRWLKGRIQVGAKEGRECETVTVDNPAEAT